MKLTEEANNEKSVAKSWLSRCFLNGYDWDQHSRGRKSAISSVCFYNLRLKVFPSFHGAYQGRSGKFWGGGNEARGFLFIHLERQLFFVVAKAINNGRSNLKQWAKRAVFIVLSHLLHKKEMTSNSCVFLPLSRRCIFAISLVSVSTYHTPSISLLLLWR